MAPNEILCLGPLRGSLSLAICPWRAETLLLFTVGCYLGSFLAPVLQAGDPSFGFRHHSSQVALPGHKYPSGILAATMGAQPAFLHLLCTPYKSHCGVVVSSVSYWL